MSWSRSPQGWRGADGAASDITGEELERAAAGERRRLRVVAGALLAAEAVTGTVVGVDGRLRVRGADALDVRERDALVLGAVVIHHRAARLLVQITHHPPVVDHRAGERQLPGGEVGERAAPAVADRPGTPGVLHHRKRRGEIAPGRLRVQLFHVARAFLHVRRRVAELDPAAHPIEQRWRDGGVAFGGKPVGQRADVTVDAEDLLDHEQRALRPAGWSREPGLKFVAVARHDGGEFAHGVAF